MKSQIKTIALSALFSAIGLCCTLSTASAESSSVHMNQTLSTIHYMSAFTTLTSEGGTKKKPLLKPGNSETEFNTGNTTTKNEYFELAIIFNDKLQQLLDIISAKESNNENINSARITPITK